MYALNNPLRFIDPSGYKYGPSDYEREIARGEHTYYNYEMAWKLGGDGRLRPDPYTWNNIGRYHHTPGPTGTTTDENGNVVDTYQDPITGGEYYNNKVGGYTVPYYSVQNVFGYSFVFEDGKFRFRKKYKDAGVKYIPLYEMVFLDALNSGDPQLLGTNPNNRMADGEISSFTAGFAFLGGMSIEYGVVTDKLGGRIRFRAINGNIGFGLTSGFTTKGIYVTPNDPDGVFTVDDFLKSYTHELEGGIAIINLSTGWQANENYMSQANPYFTIVGSGIGLSPGITFGAWWTRSIRTTKW